MIPMIGALISRHEEPADDDRSADDRPRDVRGDDPERQRGGDDPEARKPQRREAVEQLDDEHRTDDRADPERREDPAGDVRVAVVARVREQRDGDA